MKLDPIKDNMPDGDQDAIRRLVGADNIGYIDGVMFLKKPGLQILCREIIAGRAQGNAVTAAEMLTWIDGNF